METLGRLSARRRQVEALDASRRQRRRRRPPIGDRERSNRLLRRTTRQQMATRQYPLVEHCRAHAVDRMKLPLAPNRFQRFFQDFRAVLELHPCRSQHREFPSRANLATPLPMLERLGSATRHTTNASPPRETSFRIRLVALRTLNQAWIRVRVSRNSAAKGMTSLAVKATNNRVWTAALNQRGAANAGPP